MISEVKYKQIVKFSFCSVLVLAGHTYDSDFDFRSMFNPTVVPWHLCDLTPL